MRGDMPEGADALGEDGGGGGVVFEDEDGVGGGGGHGAEEEELAPSGRRESNTHRAQFVTRRRRSAFRDEWFDFDRLGEVCVSPPVHGRLLESAPVLETILETREPWKMARRRDTLPAPLVTRLGVLETVETVETGTE